MVYGWGSEQYPRYYVLNYVNWWGIHRQTRGDFPVSALSLVSCHKKHEYIKWFMGWDLNGFRDIKLFVK